MAQNIYDNPTFFAGYSQLPRQLLGLEGAPEWPTVEALLPDVTRKRVVDLGCGYGWVSRWLRAHGSAEILGIDISETMISQARARTTDAGIEYRVADIETLVLPEASFDLAFSALAFHYISDFDRLTRMLHRALLPGSRLIFTIEHPIYMAMASANWVQGDDGREIWPVRRYAIEGERRTDWFASGVVKYHRTLATTINALIDAGFTLRRLEEFSPSARQIAEWPELALEVERPMFALVAADR
ncbi:MAG: class I SAM-dependent methyltransferase [Hyphomicrobiaceae bacterium]